MGYSIFPNILMYVLKQPNTWGNFDFFRAANVNVQKIGPKLQQRVA